MSSFGLTSAAAIAVVLIVSFTLTPMLAARWIKRPEEHDTDEGFEAGEDEGCPGEDEPDGLTAEGTSSKSGRIYSLVSNTYSRLLKIALRFRWAVVLICIIVVASIYPLFRYVGMAFLPDEDESTFQVSERGPQGTSLAATQSILDRMARDLREQLPGLEHTLVFGGGFGSRGGDEFGVDHRDARPAERTVGITEQSDKSNQADPP